MSIACQPGNGQHTLVRIEYKDTPDSPVQRVEFEDSDAQLGQNLANVGWCIRWSLDALRSGKDYLVALDLADALSSVELDGDDDSYGLDSTELALATAMIDAAKKLDDHRKKKRLSRRFLHADGEANK